MICRYSRTLTTVHLLYRYILVLVQDYECRTVLRSKCRWEMEEMLVHKTVKECEDDGNSCQEKEIKVSQATM